MHSKKTWALLALLLATTVGTDARAMSCAQSPLHEAADQADAIFSGEILDVRYRERSERSLICATHSHGERCGEKVAHVAIDRVWKGTLEEETYVYSEDGCFCLGGYFTEGDEMVFMVVRPEREARGLGRIDYATGFCGRNMPLDYAVREGVVEALESFFPDAR